MIIIKNYKEKIYGNMATVFHRTSVSDLINEIYTNGFKPGSGDMYGKGFYSTYDIESQERSNMSLIYGNIVVKFAVPIKDFFIFDFKEFKKSPYWKDFSKKYPKGDEVEAIIYQIQKYNLDLSLINYVKQHANKLIMHSKPTSDMALFFYNESNIAKKVKGIIFTGRRDGKVLVSYDTDIIIPISYKMDWEEDFTKVERNKKYMKDVLMKKLSPFNPTYDILPEWLNMANYENEKIEIQDGMVIWKDGIWYNGTWKDGIWKDGSWKYGTWGNGTWGNGTWGNGTWKNGTWKDGTWEYGTWEYGTWKDGIWEYGIWENGIWKNGTWKNGTWKNGTWENGAWKYGTWKGGRILNYNTKSFEYSEVNPNECEWSLSYQKA